MNAVGNLQYVFWNAIFIHLLFREVGEWMQPGLCNMQQATSLFRAGIYNGIEKHLGDKKHSPWFNSLFTFLPVFGPPSFNTGRLQSRELFGKYRHDRLPKGNAYGANTGSDHIAAQRQHRNYVRIWLWTNCESRKLIGGEPKSCEQTCVSW